MQSTLPIATYADFYPYYLSEHRHPVCRLLPLLGTSLVLATLTYALAARAYWALLLMPVCGYGFAWVGHYFFEKNRPTTFRYPVWSLLSDFRMFFALISGRLSLRTKPRPGNRAPAEQARP